MTSIYNLLRYKLKNLTKSEGWHDNYSSWEEAKSKCTGYNAQIILEKCKASLLKVKNGEAVYERDSVVFNKVEYSWPLLVALLKCAIEHDLTINVLDYGGSLGSSYYQNRKYLSSLKKVKWSIVEQPHFVDCGKKYFSDSILNFYVSIDEIPPDRTPNIIILSSVLQYMEKPYELINKLIALNSSYIVIDRTSFINNSNDIITIQKVPKFIYDASYPCWAFNENKLLEPFRKNYTIEDEFEALDKSNLKGMYFKGFILRNIKN